MKEKNDKHSHILLIVAVLIILLIVIGCGPIKTGAHYDETTDFGEYASFS